MKPFATTPRYMIKSVIAAVLLACIGHAHASRTGPISYYKAEGNGNDENGLHNADASQAAYAPGKVGQAFSLDALNHPYIDFGSWFAFQSFTIGIWINDGDAQTGG